MVSQACGYYFMVIIRERFMRAVNNKHYGSIKDKYIELISTFICLLTDEL